MLILFELTVQCVPLAPVLSCEQFPAKDTRELGPKVTEMRVIMTDEF